MKNGAVWHWVHTKLFCVLEKVVDKECVWVYIYNIHTRELIIRKVYL